MRQLHSNPLDNLALQSLCTAAGWFAFHRIDFTWKQEKNKFVITSKDLEKRLVPEDHEEWMLMLQNLQIKRSNGSLTQDDVHRMRMLEEWLKDAGYSISVDSTKYMFSK